jgi:hypothetical protein
MATQKGKQPMKANPKQKTQPQDKRVGPKKKKTK